MLIRASFFESGFGRSSMLLDQFICLVSTFKLTLLESFQNLALFSAQPSHRFHGVSCTILKEWFQQPAAMNNGHDQNPFRFNPVDDTVSMH